MTLEQIYNEYIFTALRTIWGVNISVIKNRFGSKFQKDFLKSSEKWLSEKYLLQKKNIFTLTKNGKIFADRITSDLFILS